MKTIGLIGGTSWESTAVYYRLLNEGTRLRRGGLHSARIVLVSVDFAPFADAMAAGAWDRVAADLAAAARQVEAAGADCLALCTNTMHKVAPALEAATTLPFVHLVEATGQALAGAGIARPLLLATRYTMEDAFYRDHLRSRFGVVATVPDAPARDALQDIVFTELCRGVVSPQSRAAVLAMVEAAAQTGCDGVVLGCTELGLLLAPGDGPLPILDTTALHCEALLDFALSSAPAESRAA